MTQINHGPPNDFPPLRTLEVRNVHVYTDGMIALHDYSCPACRISHAVLDMDTGVMQPCWSCNDKGYQLVKTTSWLDKLLVKWGS